MQEFKEIKELKKMSFADMISTLDGACGRLIFTALNIPEVREANDMVMKVSISLGEWAMELESSTQNKDGDKIQVGDKVLMNDKYSVPDKNKGIEFTVKSEPFELCGTICVLLENYRGGYALDGLTKVRGGQD